MHVGEGMSRPLNTPATPKERPHRQPRRSMATLSAPALLLLFLLHEPNNAVGWVHTASVPASFRRGSCSGTAAASPAHEDPAARRALLRVLQSQRQLAAATPSACFAGGAGLDKTANTVGGSAESTAQGRAQGVTSGAARAAVPNNRAAHEKEDTAGAEPGKGEGKVVERDHVREKMKRLGRQGMWEEALERLATERKGDVPPVRKNPQIV